RIESGAGPGVTIGFTLPAEGTEAARVVLEGAATGMRAPATPAAQGKGADAAPGAGVATSPAATSRTPAAVAGKGPAAAAAGSVAAFPPTPAERAAAPEKSATPSPARVAPRPVGGETGLGEGALAERPLVLVVEDNAASARLLQETLAGAGYDVALAETVDEALTVTGRPPPAAILLDIIPQDEAGLEPLRELKRDPTMRDIPVVIQSVLSDPRRALALGASEYLVKPIQRHTLIERLSGLVR